ncbi:MAG: hypothetical protein LJF30_14400, partial [Acidobacteria bacterium]|nr:hypothetical protein [Acidobacteriota bacterium]
MSWPRQVWHVFAKDVRRFWPMLVGVGVFLGVWVWWMRPWRLAGTGLDPIEVFQQMAPFVLALLVAWVIREDPPGSDRAFWYTQSIAPSALMVAKLSFLGTFFVGIPALVHLGIANWYVTDVPWWLLGDDLLGIGAVVLLMAWVASFAPSPAGFVGLAASGYLVYRYFPTPFLAEVPAWGPAIVYLRWSGWALIGLLGVAVHLRWRNWRWTAGLGVMALWGLKVGLSHLPVRPPDSIEAPEEIRWLSGDSLAVQVTGFSRQLDDPRSRLDGEVLLQPAPGLLPRLRDVRFTLFGVKQMVPRPVSRIHGVSTGDPFYAAYPEYRILGPQLRGHRDGYEADFVILEAPSDSITKVLNGARGIALQVTVDLYRPVALATLDPRPRERIEVEGQVVRVHELERTASRAEAVFCSSESHPAYRWQRPPYDHVFGMVN